MERRFSPGQIWRNRHFIKGKALPLCNRRKKKIIVANGGLVVETGDLAWWVVFFMKSEE